MARHAGPVGVLKTGRVVAFCARNAGVLTNQWESREPVIEAYVFLPRRVAMALLALSPLLAGMGVVFAVTRNTGHIEAHLARGRDVTGCARLPSVRAAQRKPSLAGVVEAGLPPIAFIVTILTSRAVAALMRPSVLVAMAGETVGWQLHLPRGLNVARPTFYR